MEAPSQLLPAQMNFSDLSANGHAEKRLSEKSAKERSELFSQETFDSSLFGGRQTYYIVLHQREYRDSHDQGESASNTSPTFTQGANETIPSQIGGPEAGDLTPSSLD